MLHQQLLLCATSLRNISRLSTPGLAPAASTAGLAVTTPRGGGGVGALCETRTAEASSPVKHMLLSGHVPAPALVVAKCDVPLLRLGNRRSIGPSKALYACAPS